MATRPSSTPAPLGSPRQLLPAVVVLVVAFFVGATAFTRNEARTIGRAALELGSNPNPSAATLSSARRDVRHLAFELEETLRDPGSRTTRWTDATQTRQGIEALFARYEAMPAFAQAPAPWQSVAHAMAQLDALADRVHTQAGEPSAPRADAINDAAARVDDALGALIRFNGRRQRELAATIAQVNARVTRAELVLDGVGIALAAMLLYFAWRVATRYERLRAAHARLADDRAASIERSEARLRTLLQQTPVGIVILGDTVEANAQGRRLIGLPADGAIEVDDAERAFMRPDGRAFEPDQRPTRRVLRGERVERVEMALAHAGERSVPVLVNGAPIVGANGRVTGAVVTFEDITPLKDLERLRTEWSAVVAHDLRQPLASIKLSAGMLVEPARGAPQFERPVVQILRGVTRLNRMIEDLLDLSRLEVRQLPMEQRPLDLVSLVRGCVDRLAPEAPDRRFDFTAAPDAPDVRGDADRIAQVVDNLLTNAVKYGRAGSPIAVDVARTGDGIAVSIRNEGDGISPLEQRSLFQRFRGSSRARGSSIGLGLHIVRELVEAHGGHVEVTSTPGATTTFCFTLPAATVDVLPNAPSLGDDVAVARDRR